MMEAAENLQIATICQRYAVDMYGRPVQTQVMSRDMMLEIIDACHRLLKVTLYIAVGSSLYSRDVSIGADSQWNISNNHRVVSIYKRFFVMTQFQHLDALFFCGDSHIDVPVPVSIYSLTSNTTTVDMSLDDAPTHARAVSLLNGDVFMCGGRINQEVLDVAMMYGREGWIQPFTSMMHPLIGHACVLLLDGRVFICGGYTGIDTTGVCCIFDPQRRVFKRVRSMRVPRGYHAAATLPDGRVFICGGTRVKLINQSRIEISEIYDPLTDNWEPAARMRNYYIRHEAVIIYDKPPIFREEVQVEEDTVMQNERPVVLTTGGDAAWDTYTDFEAYDIATDSWYAVKRLHLGVPLNGHAMCTIIK
jgi:hypothetical protein